MNNTCPFSSPSQYRCTMKNPLSQSIQRITSGENSRPARLWWVHEIELAPFATHGRIRAPSLTARRPVSASATMLAHCPREAAANGATRRRRRRRRGLLHSHILIQRASGVIAVLSGGSYTSGNNTAKREEKVDTCRRCCRKEKGQPDQPVGENLPATIAATFSNINHEGTRCLNRRVRHSGSTFLLFCCQSGETAKTPPADGIAVATAGSHGRW